MLKSKIENPAGGGAPWSSRYLLTRGRDSIGMKEWIARKYLVIISSICWSVVLIILRTRRYRVDSTFVGCESKTSDRVLERSREERMIGSLATFRAILGCTGSCLMPGSWYSQFSLFLLYVWASSPFGQIYCRLTESNNYIAVSPCRIFSYAVCNSHIRTAVDWPSSLSHPVKSICNGLKNGQKCSLRAMKMYVLTNPGADKWNRRSGAESETLIGQNYRRAYRIKNATSQSSSLPHQYMTSLLNMIGSRNCRLQPYS